MGGLGEFELNIGRRPGWRKMHSFELQMELLSSSLRFPIWVPVYGVLSKSDSPLKIYALRNTAVWSYVHTYGEKHPAVMSHRTLRVTGGGQFIAGPRRDKQPVAARTFAVKLAVRGRLTVWAEVAQWREHVNPTREGGGTGRESNLQRPRQR